MVTKTKPEPPKLTHSMSSGVFGGPRDRGGTGQVFTSYKFRRTPVGTSPATHQGASKGATLPHKTMSVAQHHPRVCGLPSSRCQYPSDNLQSACRGPGCPIPQAAFTGMVAFRPRNQEKSHHQKTFSCFLFMSGQQQKSLREPETDKGQKSPSYQCHLVRLAWPGAESAVNHTVREKIQGRKKEPGSNP